MTCDRQMASFVRNQWSVVLAERRQDANRAIQTLAALSTPYRQPLYSYLRLRGHTPDEARELTGEFFGRLLQNKTLAYMKRDCAKLRSFLLTALNRFLSERSKVAEQAGESADWVEKAFEDNWALAILHVVYDRLRAEYERAGKAELFCTLKFCLAGVTDELPWGDLATRMGTDEASVRVSVGELRRRHGQLLREEIGALVATPNDAEDELRRLFPGVALASTGTP